MLERMVAVLSGSRANLALAATIVAVSLIGSIALVVFVLVRLPDDYFLSTRVAPSSKRPKATRWVIAVARNLTGIALIVAGIVMSVPGVPGQGVLTVVVGLLLIDLPVIRRVERRLVRQPRVLRSINRLRARFRKPPLKVDQGP